MTLSRQILVRSMSLPLSVVLSVGCAQVPVEGEFPDTQTPAQIVVTSEGGIAGMRVIIRLDSASALLTRLTCRSGGAAVQCAGGQRDEVTLTPEQVRDAFAVTQTPEFRALKADYGTSTRGADLMGHTVSITTNSRTRTIRGDDITLPSTVGKLTGMLQTALRR